MALSVVTLKQPDWLAPWMAQQPLPDGDDARLAEVLALAMENVRRGGGGPFAAIVYDRASGARLGEAVNTVIPNHTALAHAETSALALAQQRLQQFSLDFDGGPAAQLVTSSAPCTMCLGAIAWSGVVEVLFSTTRADVERIGFDEGPVTGRWRQQLRQRGIGVKGPRLRRQGRAVLDAYHQRAGVIYNGH